MPSTLTITLQVAVEQDETTDIIYALVEELRSEVDGKTISLGGFTFDVITVLEVSA